MLLHNRFQYVSVQSPRNAKNGHFHIVEIFPWTFARLLWKPFHVSEPTFLKRFCDNQCYVGYEDKFDGSVYKSLSQDFSEHQNNITFTWNTDGFPVYKSSKISMRPFYLMIHELPYHMRVKKENVLLAGLWGWLWKAIVTPIYGFF